MKRFHKFARIIIGVLFVGISASKFDLLPNAVNKPHLFTTEGFAFIQAIDASGYMFPVIFDLNENTIQVKNHCFNHKKEYNRFCGLVG